MLTIFDSLRDITLGTVFLRILIACICGAAIGLERSYRNRPAGLRTHILICVGTAAASMTGVYLFLNAKLPTDISRLGAHVVSGLGFIGAGTIILTNKESIKGLTTAAGLWTTGIIGLAIGAGYYEGGVIATVFVLLIEILLADAGSKIPRSMLFAVKVHYEHKLALDQVMRYCKDKRLAITALRVTSAENGGYQALISLRSRKTVHKETLMSHIKGIPEILEADYLEQ